MTWHPLFAQGLFIGEASPSHSEAPHSAGLFWKSDQPVAEISILITHNNHKSGIHDPGGIRTYNLVGFTIILLYICTFFAGEEPGSAGEGAYAVSATTRGRCMSCFARRSSVPVAIAVLATSSYPSAWKFHRPTPNKWPISTHTRVDHLGISSLQAAVLIYCGHFSDSCLRYIKLAYEVQRGKKYNQ
jgi:hypothetical protein